MNLNIPIVIYQVIQTILKLTIQRIYLTRFDENINQNKIFTFEISINYIEFRKRVTFQKS